MSVNKIQDENNITLDELAKVLDSGAIIQARSLLNSLQPSEIADVIEGSPRNRRDLIWKLVSNENKDANITFVLSEITWEKMKTNQIGGAQAFAEGNMTVKGDFRIMIYAGNLFKKLTT